MNKSYKLMVLGIFLCALLFLGLDTKLEVYAGEAEDAAAADYYFYEYGSGGDITSEDFSYIPQKKAVSGTASGYNVTAVSSASNMTTSSNGVALLKQFEGCSLTAYDDLQSSVVLTEDTVIKGTLTIGYGHTGSVDGKPIAWNTTITQEKAEELLKADLAVFESAVNEFIRENHITLNQNQFDALVCFTYNVGQNKWRNGSSFTLKTYLLNGISNYSNLEVGLAFAAFNTSGGEVLTGLTKRRKTEAALFLSEPALGAYTNGFYQIIASTTLNVRSGPGASYSKVGTLAKGDQVTITEINGNWGKFSGGWISLDYAVMSYASLDTPALVSASNGASGVTFSWKAVDYAALYRVYRKTASGSWTKLGETTNTTYTDTTAVGGTAYQYTVRCISSDKRNFESGYDSVGLSITYIAAPRLSGISAGNSGVTVTWSASKGAVKYRVFRKTEGGSWVRLADTAATSYTDATASTGTKYIYTVRCINSAGTAYTSAYDAAGLSIGYTSAPVLSGITADNAGITVTWNVPQGGERYRVYRKVSGGSWTKIADTTAASYTDPTGTAGTTYYYTVRCLDSTGATFVSGYQTSGISIKLAANPVLTGIENTSTGVTVKWAASKGAEKYRVYRKVSGGSWTKIAETVSTSNTDTSAVSGTTYYYTVRCVNSASKMFTSGYNTAGLGIAYLAAPKLSGITAGNSGVTVTWNASKGAVKYRVFRKTEGGSWVRLTDTAATSYTDAAASAGTKYIYTVRCINSAGTVYTSAYDAAGLSIGYTSAPVLTGIENTSTGVTVKWAASKGAEKYRVYRKVSGGSWTKIAETTATSYTDTSAVSGTTYYYTVRCVNSASKMFTSGYNTSGLSIKFLSRPAVSLTKASNGVKVSWGKITGAGGYYVYRKTSSGSWSRIAAVTGVSTVSYTDTSAKKGTTYYYTVRAYSGAALSTYVTNVSIDY